MSRQQKGGSVADKAKQNLGEKNVPRTRISATWVALGGVLVLLVVVLVFILQNLTDVEVHLFSAKWKIPLGVDLLFAVILGGAVVLLAGSLRILQLRRLTRRRAATPLPSVAVEATPGDQVRDDGSHDDESQVPAAGQDMP